MVRCRSLSVTFEPRRTVTPSAVLSALPWYFVFVFIRDRRFSFADCMSHLKLQIHATKPLTPKAVEASKWEVDIAGTRYPAVASLKPMCALCALPPLSNCNGLLQV